jgi:hypothetical protein
MQTSVYRLPLQVFMGAPWELKCKESQLTCAAVTSLAQIQQACCHNTTDTPNTVATLSQQVMEAHLIRLPLEKFPRFHDQ